MPRADDSNLDVPREWYAFASRLATWLADPSTYAYDTYFDFDRLDGTTLMRVSATPAGNDRAELTLKVKDGQKDLPFEPSLKNAPPEPKKPKVSGADRRVPRALGPAALGWNALAKAREKKANEAVARWPQEHADWQAERAEVQHKNEKALQFWRHRMEKITAENREYEATLTRIGWAPARDGFRRAVWVSETGALEGEDLRGAVELILRTLLDVLEVRRPNELITSGVDNPRV